MEKKKKLLDARSYEGRDRTYFVRDTWARRMVTKNPIFILYMNIYMLDMLLKKRGYYKSWMRWWWRRREGKGRENNKRREEKIIKMEKKKKEINNFRCIVLLGVHLWDRVYTDRDDKSKVFRDVIR